MMINALTVNVTDQKPYVEVNNSMVEDSENIYSVTFIFDEMWDGFAKTAIFQNTANKMIVMAYLDEEGKCELHPSVLKKGRLEIGVRGVKGDQVITTSASSPAVNIKENAIELDLSSESPSPFSQTLYDDLVARIEKKEEEGGAGVTDYNDLENKPCWTEVGEMVEILPETQLTFIHDDMIIATFPQLPVLQVGESYTVIWNGVSYKTTCISGESLGAPQGSFILGNIGALTGTPTEEPFLMVNESGVVGETMVIDASGLLADGDTVTVSIIQRDETVHKLDPKYLPDGIGGAEEIILTVNSDMSISCDYTPSEVYVLLATTIQRKFVAYSTANNAELYFSSIVVQKMPDESYHILFYMTSYGTEGSGYAVEGAIPFVVKCTTDEFSFYMVS